MRKSGSDEIRKIRKLICRHYVTFTPPAARETSSPGFSSAISRHGVSAHVDGLPGRRLRDGAAAAGGGGDDGVTGPGEAHRADTGQLSSGAGWGGETEGRRGPRGDGSGRGVQRLAFQNPVLVARHPNPNQYDELRLDGPGRHVGRQGRERVRRRRGQDPEPGDPQDAGRAAGGWA